MTYEGFGTGLSFTKMGSRYGTRGEHLFIVFLICAALGVKNGRHCLEDKLRAETKATNTYSLMNLSLNNRAPSKWDC
jgi:hypothetical protein